MPFSSKSSKSSHASDVLFLLGTRNLPSSSVASPCYLLVSSVPPCCVSPSSCVGSQVSRLTNTRLSIKTGVDESVPDTCGIEETSGGLIDMPLTEKQTFTLKWVPLQIFSHGALNSNQTDIRKNWKWHKHPNLENSSQKTFISGLKFITNSDLI